MMLKTCALLLAILSFIGVPLASAEDESAQLPWQKGPLDIIGVPLASAEIKRCCISRTGMASSRPNRRRRFSRKWAISPPARSWA